MTSQLQKGISAQEHMVLRSTMKNYCNNESNWWLFFLLLIFQALAIFPELNDTLHLHCSCILHTYFALPGFYISTFKMRTRIRFDDVAWERSEAIAIWRHVAQDNYRRTDMSWGSSQPHAIGIVLETDRPGWLDDILQVHSRQHAPPLGVCQSSREALYAYLL